ncbi:MAG: TraR/DksA C4-type zinc finger protein [Patescibacteria group bacterium]
MASKEDTKELLEREIKKREKELVQRSLLVKDENEALRAVSSGDSSGDHSASWATYEVDYEGVRLSRLNSEMTLLVQAKAKVDSGEYGICHCCGEAIDKKRLEVRPLAEDCISCARKKELALKKLKRKGDDLSRPRYELVRMQ